MAHRHLTTYLQDHRAGAVAAIGLLEHLEAHPNSDLSTFAKALRIDIEDDIKTLEAVMERAGVASSAARKAAGWLGERIAALKVAIDDPADGALRTLETIEALALGIDGKRALWVALEGSGVPSVARACDFSKLAARANDQRQAIEAHRLRAARAALDA